MRNLIRNKNFYIILLIDAGLIFAAHLLSYLLRFEGQFPVQEWKRFTTTIPYILIFKLFIFLWLGLYRGMWRYTSLVDLLKVLKAATVSSVTVTLMFFSFTGLKDFPVPFLSWTGC